jgi:uncharacterized tellurite resistance protein B-like protein
MSQTVLEIIQKIKSLPEDERLELDEELARIAEADWKREAEDARRLAKMRGIDQQTIDSAVEKVRYGS